MIRATTVLLVIAVGLLPPLSQARDTWDKPCDDQVLQSEITLTFPGRLENTGERSFQEQADHLFSHLIKESFEETAFSQAFYPQAGQSWALQQGEAKQGTGYAEFGQGRSPVTLDESTGDPDNWLVMGPFDLSRPAEANFSFFVQLGDHDRRRQASLATLVSTDGVTFHGSRFDGVTCSWYYRRLLLTDIPELGNVCGSEEVWFAFVPLGRTAHASRPIGIDHVRLLTENPGLPPKYDPPVAGRPESRATYMELLEHYSPHIAQEVECTKFGDKITRYDYDGNQAADDNWDNLGVNCGSDCGSAAPGCAQARPLPAYVYASIVETDTEYYLGYCLLHPADDFHCHWHQHENDLEGIIVMVRKDGTTFGDLRMVQVQAHNDFFAYVPYDMYPPHEHGIYEGARAVEDDNILVWGSHPIVCVEGGGHGIRYDPTEFSGGHSITDWFVQYRYTGVAEDPPSWKYTHACFPGSLPENMYASYDLILLHCTLWQRRNFYCGTSCMFQPHGDVHMDRYDILDVGTEFDQNQCDGAANPPWWWRDNDDEDDGRHRGEWFLDPAWYHEWQFNWTPAIDHYYDYSPFVRNHLCGEVYDLLGAFETPDWGRYVIQCDVEVPEDKSLWVGNDVDIIFPVGGYSLTAHGPMTVMGSPQPVTITRDIPATVGMKIYGRAVFRNGGGIGFPN